MGQSTWGQSLELKTIMRSLVLLCALTGIALASEASFNEFAKTFNKKYASTEEYAKRMEIFMDNYKLMLKHNQEYEEGRVSWWKGHRVLRYDPRGVDEPHEVGHATHGRVHHVQQC